MFTPRKIEQEPNWIDDTGTKIYTISANAKSVNHAHFSDALIQAKTHIDINWAMTPSFAIFHEGATYPYLILCWWQNDNELFTRVYVKEAETWLCEVTKYSFCVYDLAVIWAERNIFIETIDCPSPCLERYQQTRVVIEN
ncbi:hypothetical protein LP316_13530 [Thalassotalea sp. LPB0316]|uniref:hypothetical protein n=1 Tax=Thalassotalea sp. LPB0316 TaxID=2769490 RepID=UPI00186686FF|nr:hypothetical protein [Thalassotalea sp. LPB0316]QOL25303.1 hypothetical protein LP316_13530 [Thalassotalea sp. LPB0316]